MASPEKYPRSPPTELKEHCMLETSTRGNDEPPPYPGNRSRGTERDVRTSYVTREMSADLELLHGNGRKTYTTTTSDDHRQNDAGDRETVGARYVLGAEGVKIDVRPKSGISGIRDVTIRDDLSRAWITDV